MRKESCERCGASEKLQVHHIDEDPSNNNASNLETLCATCHNRHHQNQSKVSPEDVAEIRASSDAVAVLALRYGIREDSIRNILNGKTWAHEGLERKIEGAAA